MYVNHTHASIFYSQAANFPIYLINTPSPDKTPHQSCYFFYVFFWYSPHFNFVTTKRDLELFHYACIGHTHINNQKDQSSNELENTVEQENTSAAIKNKDNKNQSNNNIPEQKSLNLKNGSKIWN